MKCWLWEEAEVGFTLFLLLLILLLLLLLLSPPPPPLLPRTLPVGDSLLLLLWLLWRHHLPMGSLHHHHHLSFHPLPLGQCKGGKDGPIKNPPPPNWRVGEAAVKTVLVAARPHLHPPTHLTPAAAAAAPMVAKRLLHPPLLPPPGIPLPPLPPPPPPLNWGCHHLLGAPLPRVGEYVLGHFLHTTLITMRTRR
jgi:hypothetical protein